MTVRDLLDILDGLDDDIEVRVAHQPRWAFEYALTGGAVMETCEENAGILYLAEGEQIGYLPQAAAVAIGWADERPDEEDEA